MTDDSGNDSWGRPSSTGTFPAPSAPTPPTAAWPPTPPTVGVPPTETMAGPTDQPMSMYAPPQPSAPKTVEKRSGAGRKLAFGALAVAAMVGSGAVGALIATSVDGDDDPTQPEQSSGVTVSLNSDRDPAEAMNVAAVADVVAPSVVTVSADVESEFGGEEGLSVGTGVITTADGEIVTNAHVVDGATNIRVRLAGESEPIPATLLASDPGNDLALLRIAGDGYTPATFAQPDSTQIGDEVLAIGFALDLDGEPSVTLGIVSALDRTIETGGDVFLDGLIQTDAAISSGNSGGPLVNSAGEVVGINTAVARGDFQTAASNIGFAISVREALPILESLREQADGATRDNGYLGVSLAERLDGGQGAIVDSVEAGTPAEQAGVLAGDVVIEVDGTPINGTTGLVAAIRDREPGDEVEIVVVRDGEPVSLTATLTIRETE